MVAISPSMSGSSYEVHCEKQDETMLSSLLRRMNPTNCLCFETESCPDANKKNGNDSNTELNCIIPRLLKDIDAQESNKSVRVQNVILEAKTAALNKLYELASIKRNRIPIVCTSKWDAISSLANCLVRNNSQGSKSIEKNDEVRRLACLALNTLSIPFENKNVMIHGPHFRLLVGNMTKVIRMQVPETTYLCCICLMNLSCLEDGVEQIMKFSPLFSAREPSPRRRCRSNSLTPWLDDPNSTLRSLESLMKDQQPFLMSRTFSVEGEAIRWAVGLLRNLTRTNNHCAMIAKTEIPALVLGFVERTPHQVIKWATDSLEEMSLTVVDQLAACPESCEKLKESGAAYILGSIKTGAGQSKIKGKISSIFKSLEG